MIQYYVHIKFEHILQLFRIPIIIYTPVAMYAELSWLTITIYKA